MRQVNYKEGVMARHVVEFAPVDGANGAFHLFIDGKPMAAVNVVYLQEEDRFIMDVVDSRHAFARHTAMMFRSYNNQADPEEEHEPSTGSELGRFWVEGDQVCDLVSVDFGGEGDLDA